MKDDLIALLQGEGFYLGGSRRMAEKYPSDIIITRPDTDWDFSAQHNADTVRKLKALGFKKLSGTGYKDSQAVQFYEMGGVQVVTRYNIDVYRSAFEAVEPGIYKAKLWKSSPQITHFNKRKVRNYFNAMFDLHSS
jgi:hypothetical protein